uniref:protein rep n=1 Tax=Magnetospirillum sp. ME-1 TaxID=1639348 RepID=UPI001444C128|nr:protein rep [Magnetospirillum sp. ME-1]
MSEVIRLPIHRSEEASDWHERKRAAGRYAYALTTFAASASSNHPALVIARDVQLRLSGCGHMIVTGHAAGAPLDDVGTLEKASWCNHRLCPRCGPVLGSRQRRRAAKGVDALLKKHKGLRAIRLDLTVRNVPWPLLPAWIALLQAAFSAMIRAADVDRHLVAAIRAIEVTRGQDGLAHPHIHSVLFVRRSYFDLGRHKDELTGEATWAQRQYIDKADVIQWTPRRNRKTGDIIELRSYGASYTPVKPVSHRGWISRWAAAADLDYEPSIYVKAIPKGKPEAVKKAVMHAVKYALKPATGHEGAGHRTGVSGEELAWLALAIKGRRLIEYYGDLRELVPAESEDEDLNDAEEKEEKLLPVHRVWKWRTMRDRKAPSAYELIREVLADTPDQLEVALLQHDATAALVPPVRQPRRSDWGNIPDLPPPPSVSTMESLPPPRLGWDITREAHRIAGELGIPNATDERMVFVRAYVAYWPPQPVEDAA